MRGAAMSAPQPGTLPRHGLLLVEGAPGAAAVADELGGVLATAADLDRLREGGVQALPRRFGELAEASRERAAGQAEAQKALVAARREMLDVVVPPTIRYLAIGCTLALFVLAFSFAWPEHRGIFFPASGAVLALMIAYAVLQSIRSAQAQRRLQEKVYDRQDAVEILRAEARRVPALVAAAGLPTDSEFLARVPDAAAEAGWGDPAADPDRPLVVDASTVGPDAAWLEAWSKGRLVIVVTAPGAAAPEAAWDHTLTWPEG
jgi:hypothetical protein